uniref:G-patch domain-containing protein n=1 Tax=Elaeophora elaphi TaxID=1147741 RepID=A0A0R3S4F4_9BILA
MTSTSEHSGSFGMSNTSKPCQKPSDVKFVISTLKRNVTSVSNNNILQTENNESDDNAEDTVNESKRQRLTLINNGQMADPGKEQKSRSTLVIPMVMQKDWRIERLLQMKNESKLNEEELAKLDLLTEAASSSIQVAICFLTHKVDAQISEPLNSVDADYDSVPIEVFGLAVLRGCGWQEGEGIGKTNKKVVPLRISSRRPKGLGLGASIVSESTNKDLDSDGEKLNNLKKTALVKITGGIYRNLYGRIESFDEDNASVIVRLAVDGKNIRVNHYAVIVVSNEEYERKAERSHDDKHSNGKSELKDNEARMAQKKNYKKQKSKTAVNPNRIEMWARPELKVRFIDKKFKNGKLYNEKVRILDVADRKNCTVEDSFGNKYFQISEHWLETVIPKTRGSKLMVVNGPFRGNTAVLEARDKKKHIVFARLITTDEIVTVCFDDVCEYLGSFDDF